MMTPYSSGPNEMGEDLERRRRCITLSPSLPPPGLQVPTPTTVSVQSSGTLVIVLPLPTSPVPEDGFTQAISIFMAMGLRR